MDGNDPRLFIRLYARSRAGCLARYAYVDPFKPVRQLQASWLHYDPGKREIHRRVCFQSLRIAQIRRAP